MGNELDWDKLVEDIGPRLYRYFRVRFSDEQADELTQETLLRLVRKVRDGKFDPKRGSLRMLSFGIAHYAALELKDTSKFESIDDWEESLADDSNVEQLTIDRDSAFRVREHMAHLSSVEQQILSLMVDEELALSDIAMILQISEGTVKSHVFRAKRKLIQMIHKETAL